MGTKVIRAAYMAEAIALSIVVKTRRFPRPRHAICDQHPGGWGTALSPRALTDRARTLTIGLRPPRSLQNYREPGARIAGFRTRTVEPKQVEAMNLEQFLQAPMPPLGELLEKGGALMIPILALNAGAWLVFVERGLFWLASVPAIIRERRIVGRYFREGSGKTFEAYLKEKWPVVATRLLESGWIVKPLSLFQTREGDAWEEETDAVVARTEKWLGFLTLAAALGTSFGLLGTVIGVSSSLKFIESDFSSTVDGLSVALYTTVGGLVVSIQATLFLWVYQAFSNALNNSISGYVRELRIKRVEAGKASK